MLESYLATLAANPHPLANPHPPAPTNKPAPMPDFTVKQARSGLWYAAGAAGWLMIGHLSPAAAEAAGASFSAAMASAEPELPMGQPAPVGPSQPAPTGKPDAKPDVASPHPCEPELWLCENADAPSSREPEFWGADGWTDEASAERYTLADTTRLILPPGGCWVKA